MMFFSIFLVLTGFYTGFGFGLTMWYLKDTSKITLKNLLKNIVFVFFLPIYFVLAMGFVRWDNRKLKLDR